MKRTGEDISHVSKETSLGGLAAILGECWLAARPEISAVAAKHSRRSQRKAFSASSRL